MSQERGESPLQPGGPHGPWEQPARPSGPPTAGIPDTGPQGTDGSGGRGPASGATPLTAGPRSHPSGPAPQPSGPAPQPSGPAPQPSGPTPPPSGPALQPSAGANPGWGGSAPSVSARPGPDDRGPGPSPWDRSSGAGVDGGRGAAPTQVFPAPAGVPSVQPRSVQATMGAPADRPGPQYGPGDGGSAGYGSTTYGSGGFGSNGSTSNGPGYGARPGYGGPTDRTAVGPAPQTYGPVAPAAPTRDRRRGPGLIATTVVAAVTALLVGGAAGLGGAVLGSGRLDPTRTAPTTSAPPTVGAGQSQGPGTPAPTPTGPLTGSAAVAAKMLPSTVTILVSGPRGRGSGSGFVLDAEGRIMTNNHVVEVAADGGMLTAVFNDNRRATARIVGRSAAYDLAVIQVDPDGLELVPSEIGDSDAIAVGDETVALGAPRGLGGTVTAGILSARDRPVAVGRSASDASFLNALQTDAAINPGNSGGPLADMQGRVIGVNSAILSNATESTTAGNIGIGFAIPINQAMEIAEQLVEQGFATFPTVGLMTETAGNSEGARVEQVEPGSPAAEAGLETGDLVVGVDDRPVGSMVEFIVAIRTHRPGDEVRVVYTRNGAEQQAVVVLGEQRG